MIRNQIVSAVKKILKEMGIQGVEPIVEHPADSAHGDYASNIAMAIFGNKELGIRNKGFKSPMEFTEKIKNAIIHDSKFMIHFDRVEAVSPGFINFSLSKDFLQHQIHEIVRKGDSYGSLEIGKGKKARVEYVSANPTGPLHIGNARGGPIGDVLSNVLGKAGYEVLHEYLHNDVGGQVQALGKILKVIVEGKPSSENQYQGEYINDLAKEIGSKIDGKTDEEIGRMAVDILFKEIIEDAKAMGIEFDYIVKESELREKAKDTLSVLEKKGVLKEKDGAVWFAPSDEFLKDRETVVVKSDGGYTYFTADIVYHKEKCESGADLIVDVFGSNHAGHVPRLQAVVKALGFNVDRLRFILYQFVRVKRGEKLVKMSKRAGNFVTAREVLDEVGKDAFRFFMLMHRPETHMDFDLELAKKKASDNPVFYVQYAHARIESVFKKAGGRIQFAQGNFDLLAQKEELVLLRKLIKLPELVEKISGDFGVNKLTTYAIEIADLFHRFYERHKVISEDKELTLARLGLLKATQIVLKNTLGLLGITAPERM